MRHVFVALLCVSLASSGLLGARALGLMRPVPEAPAATEWPQPAGAGAEALTWPPPTPGVGDEPSTPAGRLQVGTTVTVDFDIDETSWDGLTRRQRADQLRDWLARAVADDAGMPPEAAVRTFFDCPPLRSLLLRHVAAYEHGPSRRFNNANDELTVLVEVGDEDAAADAISAAADEYRVTRGEFPGWVHRVDCELLDINTPSPRARLTRQAPIEGSALGTSAWGYVEEVVASAAALESHLARTDDLVFVAARGDGLVLGGRRLRVRPGKAFSLADVAAVWQAQAELTDIHRELERAQGEAQSKYDRSVEAWRKHASDDDSLARLLSRRDTWGPGVSPEVARMLEELTRADTGPRVVPRVPRRVLGPGASPLAPEHPDTVLARLEAELDAKRRSFEGYPNGVPEHTGFSLDHHFDAAVIGAFIESGAVPTTLRPALEAAHGALIDGDDGEMQRLLHGWRAGEDLTAAVHAWLIRHLGEFQAARYDGRLLQGTEVGMTLFYTDLLAKLWSFDHEGIATAMRHLIEDFPSRVEGRTGAVHRMEVDANPQGRLWFGPDWQSLAIGGQHDLRFERWSVRLFAAASGIDGVEIPATEDRARVLDWYDDHYAELASHEPELERLNAYMKWSAVACWLAGRNEDGRLGFLREVEVVRTNWFDTWVERHPELTFKQWGTLRFGDPGSRESAAETLALVYSDPYMDFDDRSDSRRLSGGVSGFGPERIKALTPVRRLEPSSPAGLMTRGADHRWTGLTPNRVVSAAGTTHQFSTTATGAAMDAKPRLRLELGARGRKLSAEQHAELLRSLHIDVETIGAAGQGVVLRPRLKSPEAILPNQSVTCTAERMPAGMRWTLDLEGKRLGAVTTRIGGPASMQVECRAGDLARLLTRAGRPGGGPDAHPIDALALTIATPSGERAVLTPGSSQWYRMRRAGTETSRGTARMRVHDDVAWAAGAAEVKELLHGHASVTIDTAAPSIVLTVGSAPSGMRRLLVSGAGSEGPIEARIDGDGRRLTFRTADLDPLLEDVGGRLVPLFSAENRAALARAAASGASSVNLPQPLSPSTAFMTAALRGDFAAARAHLERTTEGCRAEVLAAQRATALRVATLGSTGRAGEAGRSFDDYLATHGRPIPAPVASSPGSRLRLARTGGWYELVVPRGSEWVALATASYQDAAMLLLAAARSQPQGSPIEVELVGFNSRELDNLAATWRTQREPHGLRADTVLFRRADPGEVRPAPSGTAVEIRVEAERATASFEARSKHATLGMELTVRVASGATRAQAESILSRILAAIRRFLAGLTGRVSSSYDELDRVIRDEIRQLRREGLPVGAPHEYELRMREELEDVYIVELATPLTGPSSRAA